MRRKGETGYNSLVDRSDVGYFFVDAKGVFQRVNDAWLQMHGYASQKEVIGKHFSVTQIEEKAQEADRQIESLLVGSWLPIGEHPRRRKDGSIGYNTVLATPVFHKGKTVGVEGLLFDAVDEKLEEEEADRRRELDTERQRRIQALSDFAGNVAHDFNNILMAILGHAEFALADLPISSPTRSNITAIQHETKRAAQMCNHLLSLTDRDHAVVETLCLSEMVQSMHHLLQVLVPPNTELLYELVESPPLVEGDPGQVRQIVANLVARSCEFDADGSGSVYLTTRVMDSARFQDNHFAGLPEKHLPEAFVMLAIGSEQDALAGDRQDRVFDYSQDSRATIEQLALSAVENIVHSHRGLLKILQEPGRGLTFVALFPASRATRTPEHPTEETSWRGFGKVLFVDDDEQVRLVAGSMLERMGFELQTATSGQEALDLFNADPDGFSLVLLDVSMPGMDGIEVLESMLARRHDVPIIMSSGFNEEGIADRVPDESPAHFIQKPYDMDALGRKIREILTAKT